ncbi:HNH endonuclease [Priestia megaterium]|uniref:HNH endonuclease n=1 Tax=Priestia megaterium TaxID=1404 RepID=UPI00355BEF13
MTGRDMFGNKISEEQRKASLLQALGIAGAGALSTKVAGKMGQSLATKGTEKLNNMRNTLRTSAVANVTKQAYQSVKNAPASWTQPLRKTYNNILDSSMPRLVPDLVPAGPALAQQTVRETLQNVKKQTMQMVTKVKYYPDRNSYRGPGGRFMSESDVKKLGDEIEVETVSNLKEGKKTIQPLPNVNEFLPKKSRKPIQPREYKEMIINDDGTKTYTLISGKNGKEYKVTYDIQGYPIFNSVYEVNLVEELHLASDARQFRSLTKGLALEIEKNKLLAGKFNDAELRLISAGEVQSVLLLNAFAHFSIYFLFYKSYGL